MAITRLVTSSIQNDGGYVRVNTDGSITVHPSIGHFVTTDVPGLVSGGVADNVEALQAYVNAAIYTASHQTFTIPDGDYLISTALQLGYGAPSGDATVFAAVRVQGSGMRFAGDSQFHGVKLVCDYTDAPGVNIQGGRGTYLSLLTLEGANRDYLYLHSPPVVSVSTTLDGSDLSLWLDPDLVSDNPDINSSTAPYTGLTIDAYTGTRPATSYPDVDYPAGYSQTQWGRAQTDRPVIQDFEAIGFYIAVATQPSGGDGNGDFLNLWRCKLWYNVYGISISQTQSRLVTCYYCDFTQVYCVLTNSLTGVQNGELDCTMHKCSFNAVVMLCDIAQAYGGPVVFDACYGEIVWRLGDFDGSATASVATRFRDCRLDMRVSDALGRPATIASGGYVILEGGIYITYDTAMVSSDVECLGVKMRTGLAEQLSVFTLSQRKSLNVALGLLRQPNVLNDRFQQIKVTQYFYDLSSDGRLAFDSGNLFKPLYGRDSNIPWSVAGIADPGGAGILTAIPPPRAFTKAYDKSVAGNVLFSSTTDRDSTITVLETEIPIQLGDVFIDSVSFTIWRVNQVTQTLSPVTGLMSACVCDVRATNNLYGTPLALREEIEKEVGYLYVLRSGVYLPAVVALYGDCVEGNAVIDNCHRAQDGYAGDTAAPERWVVAGDYLLQGLIPGEVPLFNDYTYVVEADIEGGTTAGGKITVDDGAKVLQTGRFCLGYFLRQEPQPPVVLFTAENAWGTFPRLVQFNNFSTSTGTVTYAWDFGDGNTSTSSAPSHTYAGPGPYTVTLTVVSAYGTTTGTRTNYINDSGAIPAQVAQSTNYWRMGQGDGIAPTNQTDAIGISDLRPVGGVAIGTVAGFIGGTLASDMTTTFYSFYTPHRAVLSWTGDRTVWFWFRYTAADPEYQGLFSKSTMPSFYMIGSVYNFTKAVFGATTADLTPLPSINTWHLLMVTFDADGGTGGTGLARYYIDNAELTGSPIDLIPSLANSSDFYVGLGNGVNNIRGYMQQGGVAPSVFDATSRAYIWNSGVGRQVF